MPTLGPSFVDAPIGLAGCSPRCSALAPAVAALVPWRSPQQQVYSQTTEETNFSANFCLRTLAAPYYRNQNCASSRTDQHHDSENQIEKWDGTRNGRPHKLI